MHALVAEPLDITLRKAEEIFALGRAQADTAMLVGAYRSLADTTYFMGAFQQAKEFAERGVALCDAHDLTSCIGEVSLPIVTCLCFDALARWQMGDPAQALGRIEEAKRRAQALSNAHSMAVALHFEGYVSHFCGLRERAAETAEQLIELSTANGFRFWLAGAHVQLGWAETLLGAPEEGLPLIVQGIQEWRATGAELIAPYWLAMLAEAHIASGKTTECLVIIDEACHSADGRAELWWKADLLRLKGFCLIAQREYDRGKQSLRSALELSRQQRSVSLELRVATEMAKLFLIQENKPHAARKLIEPLYRAVSHELQTEDLRSARLMLDAASSPA
jgi:tetratricopeptide (TPR) repeat protein